MRNYNGPERWHRREVKVKTYTSVTEAEYDVDAMPNGGWEMEGQSSATRKWKPLTGFFTNKQIITVSNNDGGC